MGQDGGMGGSVGNSDVNLVFFCSLYMYICIYVVNGCAYFTILV